MRKVFLIHIFVLLLVELVCLSCSQTAKTTIPSTTANLRAPAYPLVTIDPYTSAWSTSDKLYDTPVKHWTDRTHSLIGAIRVDRKVYRFMGKEDIPLKTLVPMANEEAWEGKYTTSQPQKGWEQSNFNTKGWETGKAAFGSKGFQSASTIWDTKNIWVRREFTLPEIKSDAEELYLSYSHDDDFELYLNGKEVVNTGNRAKNNVLLKIDPSLLNIGEKNVIAAHCLDRGGLAYVDFGIYTQGDRKEVFEQTAVQNSVSLSATQTHYEFTCGPVDLILQFVSPLLPYDLDLLSRPVNYINYEVVSNDGEKHDVQIYFETTPEWAVNELSQEVEAGKGETGKNNFCKGRYHRTAGAEKKGRQCPHRLGLCLPGCRKKRKHLRSSG